ncbi:protein kinase domain-containing protein [Streptomyces virginiae]|uniref:protein kinase domain-containing protein n=1 Tax=Streptomyces virginiae TaxID=1961 RepID=UPI002255141C|nr:protein kinase [Streptomyces virginiae]MCX4957922.1 protein kinase [Streptomyces virginiae]
MTSQNLHIGPDAAADRYRLLRSIGRGGEAVLYLAEIELAGGSEPVVVKVLDSKTTITPDIFDRISQKWNEQAELLRFVHRPGVVGVREHFEGPPIHRPGESSTLSGRALVLVMNHVDGLDLRDWRAERTLATAAERREVMRTLEQLADVLDWLHSGKATPSGRQVVHGDLSPGNVMVDAHGQATLVDFGLSKLTADHQTAEVWFTPGYAAPEVFDGKRTPGTDRYAFGAIAYFLLSGESPPATPEQLSQALTALPQIAVLDAEQRARIATIYSADPGKRPVNLAGWMKDIRHAVVSTTTATSQRAAEEAPPRPAAPPPPVVPPQPVTPPPTAPAAPPAYAPAAQPVQQPVQQSVQPVQHPAQPAQSEPATVPEPAPVPTHTPTPAPQPQPDPGSVPAGYGPTYNLSPAPAPEPVVPKKKRRTGLILGSVAAVLVLASLAVVGVQLLGDKDKENAAGGDKPGGTSAPQASASARASESAEPTPSEASPKGSASPNSSSSPGDPGSVKDSNVADLTVLSSVGEVQHFEVGSAKLNTKEYGAALLGSCYHGATVEYDVNRAWSTLEFTVGVDDGSTMEQARVTISVDDKPALFSEAVHLGKPVTKSLDIKGALRLRLKVEEGCRDTGNAVIAAPVLKR